jgi:hypothetical protein
MHPVYVNVKGAAKKYCGALRQINAIAIAQARHRSGT